MTSRKTELYVEIWYIRTLKLMRFKSTRKAFKDILENFKISFIFMKFICQAMFYNSLKNKLLLIF